MCSRQAPSRYFFFSLPSVFLLVESVDHLIEFFPRRNEGCLLIETTLVQIHPCELRAVKMKFNFENLKGSSKSLMFLVIFSLIFTRRELFSFSK